MKKAAKATTSEKQRITAWLSPAAHEMAMTAIRQFHEHTRGRTDLGAILTECVQEALSRLLGKAHGGRNFILETLATIKPNGNGKPHKKPMKAATAVKPPTRHTG
jgi:hypothetical protein